MTSANTFTTPSFNTASLIKPALIGWGIGLAVILFFIFNVDHPNVAWGNYWRIKPVVLTPLVTAGGAAFFALMTSLKLQGLKKILVITVGVIGFIISLWIGIVLGLNGTLWN
ncbi:hypothetical protein [Mucilaginibacter antarcticus]|uniref:Potassium transporter KefB n=1 Tax=Mucilaginibacter antarcticus TaxID=1855725 RepID=A0ABW5XHK0_9SPHI